jgi:hypothetical protein
LLKMGGAKWDALDRQEKETLQGPRGTI